MADGKNVGTLAEAIRQRFGFATYLRENPEAADVDIAPKVLLKQNPNRVAFGIINLSAGTIYARPRGVPSATAGIRLDANGGFIVAVYDADFDLVGYQWSAMGTADDLAVYVWEILTYDRLDTLGPKAPAP